MSLDIRLGVLAVSRPEKEPLDCTICSPPMATQLEPVREAIGVFALRKVGEAMRHSDLFQHFGEMEQIPQRKGK